MLSLPLASLSLFSGLLREYREDVEVRDVDDVLLLPVLREAFVLLEPVLLEPLLARDLLPDPFVEYVPLLPKECEE